MKSQRGLSDPDLKAARGRSVIPRIPDVVRARALARARAAIAMSAAAPAPDVVSHWRGLRIAVAAGVALAFGAAGAVAAFHGRRPRAPESAPSAPSEATRPTLPAHGSMADVPEPPPNRPSIAKAQRSPRPASAQESYAAELVLLQRAHATYAARDFAGTLTVVAEHARRFPNGRLSEEREGLRVESLAGLGPPGRDPPRRRGLRPPVSTQRAPAPPPGDGEPQR